MAAKYFTLILAESVEIPTLQRQDLPNDQFAYYCDDLDVFKAAMKSLRMNIRRYCMIYYDEEKEIRQGTVKATKGKFEFGRQDEIFVPIGEDGLPLANATMIRRADGAESGSYERVQDAIDLACQRYGLALGSEELKDLLTTEAAE